MFMCKYITFSNAFKQYIMNSCLISFIFYRNFGSTIKYSIIYFIRQLSIAIEIL